MLNSRNRSPRMVQRRDEGRSKFRFQQSCSCGLPTPLAQIQNAGAACPAHVAACRAVSRVGQLRSAAGQQSLVKSASDSQLPRATPDFFRSPGAFVLRQKLHSAKSQQPRGDVFERWEVPNEILLYVFSFLPKKSLVKCLEVSRRFRRIGLNASLWERVDCGLRHVDSSQIHALIDRGVVYLRIARSEIQLQSQTSLANWISNKLSFLDMSMAEYGQNPKLVAQILCRCRRLRCLSLENGAIDDEGAASLGTNNELVRLNLALCQGLTTKGITSIIKGCRRLVELNLGWTSLNAESASVVCSNAPSTLVRLNMSGGRNCGVSDSDLEKLQSIEALTELDVSDCVNITTAGLNHVLCCPKLAVLHMNRCYGVEPINYCACHKLTELNIMGCVTDEGLTVLCQRLGKCRVNGNLFSTVARPTVGNRRSSIWEHKVRDVE